MKSTIGSIGTIIVALVLLSFVWTHLEKDKKVKKTKKNSTATFEQILFQAKKSRKMILIYVADSNCIPCDKFEKKVLKASILRKKFDRHFLFYKIDLNASKEADYFIERYRINEVPSLVVVDDHGSVILKTIGSKSTSEFNQFLKIARKKTH